MALSNNHPGARPRRFRRTRMLIVGCGDVGQRVAALLPKASVQAMALSPSPDKYDPLRQLGLTVLPGNLDQAPTLYRLAGIAQRILHLAPPPNLGWEDHRTRHLLRALRLRHTPAQLVYASTTGVYGDRAGAITPESTPMAPGTPRAQRRVSAELMLRRFSRDTGCTTLALRIPGIYAPDRNTAQVQARLAKHTPVLHPNDDVYTNHIHADDLARACWLALWRGQALRAINVCDDSDLRMGDYFDWLADHFGLPRPPRVHKSEAPDHMPLQLLSFMGESRRITNHRLKYELGLHLHYPTIQAGWSNAGLPAPALTQL